MEIIVVDDGSEDETVSIAREFGCKVISHPVSKGPVAAKNTGLTVASGEAILFLDHDDVMRDGALKALISALESHPDAYAVQAKVKDFLSPEIGSMPGTFIRPEAYYGLFTGATLIRKEAFDIIGPFSEKTRSGEIIEWTTKMETNGLEIVKLDLISTDRRIHHTNFGKKDAKLEFRDYAALLRERLKTKTKV